ncbi:hypothetical protein TTHERM_00022840 (macronuclear) [Tetrahymena thermophila SB210]|uniref:Uncharacterized protein n=1 Tax=Tetrahymena thermophila (strain SB210) TaxID=312017 RepID=Q22R98_TETTS|nr:hypothetical protein TTHERM_00022840 [Tetrahymena thermophila SB210]EAR88224.1 hypothetical protein TTHERM_00022840 [Tetrahymena thermophila SB210]|eukprot:XP_001008469.1 hypothetical protein TTHERM_00022840 [Tetrahymena thermophila SB210]
MDQLKLDFSLNNSRLCPVHKKIQVYLNVDTKQQNTDPIFKCVSCVSKELHQQKNQIKVTPLDDILNDEEIQLDNWLIDVDFGKFHKLFIQEQLNIQQELDKFFKNFRSSIINKLDIFEESVRKRYEELEFNKTKIIQYIKDSSMKEQVRSILKQSQNLEQQTKSYKELIKHLEKNEKDIQDNYHQLQQNFNFYAEYLCIENISKFQIQLESVLNNISQIANYQIVDMLKIQDQKVLPIENDEGFNDQIYHGQISNVCSLYEINCNQITQYVKLTLQDQQLVHNYDLQKYEKKYLTYLLFPDQIF